MPGKIRPSYESLGYSKKENSDDNKQKRFKSSHLAVYML